MRYLIIGGSGAIGMRICKQLHDKGQHVASMDLSPTAYGVEYLKVHIPDLKHYRADISNLQQLMEVLYAEKSNVIINLAYIMSTPTTELLYKSAEVNVLGTVNMFEAARYMGVKRVVYASSIAVFGDRQNYYGDRPIKEDEGCPFQMIGRIYAATKILTEQFARKYIDMYGMDIVGVRPCIVIAPEREYGRTVTISQLISVPPIKKKVHVLFREDMPVCIQYVEDTARVFTELAVKDKLQYPVYNSGGHATTLRKVKKIVLQYVPDAEITFEEGAKDHLLVSNVDGSRIRAEVPYQFPTLEESIQKIMEWALQKNRLEAPI